jgi:hypothetical protein
MDDPGQARRVSLIALAAYAALAAIIGAVLFEFRLDDAFISYRYARNIAQGTGFVYNPGEPPVLSVTNPLYVLLLSLICLVTPHLAIVGSVLSIAAIGAGAWLIADLAQTGTQERAAGWVAGLFYVSFPLLWLALGLETALQLALGLLGVWLYVRGREPLAALALGLATLTRPDMVILSGVIVLDSIIQNRRFPIRPALIYCAVLLAWSAWATPYFGSPLPATLGAKSAQAALGITGIAIGTTFIGGLGRLGAALLRQSWLWAAVGAVAMVGFTTLRRHRWAILLAAWGVLHLLGYVILGTVPYRWYYAPLVPALAALFGLAAGRLATLVTARWRVAAMAGAALLAGLAAGRSLVLIDRTPRHDVAFLDGRGIEMLPTVDWDIYYRTGTWLRENTPPEATVGVAEVGQLGYYAERPMVGYLGLIQPEIADALSRRDVYWWLPHTTPDYLVLSETTGRALYGHSLEGDRWFDRTYAEVTRFDDSRYTRSPMVIYRRVADSRPVQPVAIERQVFGNGMALERLAVDFPLRPLPPGSAVRARLEWTLDQPISTPQHVVMRLTRRDWALAGQVDRRFDLSTWPLGERASTYLTFELASELEPGAYRVEVGVGPEPDQIEWRQVALAKVPLPEETVNLGAFSGQREVLGVIALNGYQLDQSPDELTLRLAWEAVGAPEADYVVFVHVRDPQDNIVAQIDIRPRGSLYPTLVWDAGEEVVGTYTLDIRDLPPGTYDVVVGLYVRGGARLTTPDGRDSILLEPITVEGAS